MPEDVGDSSNHARIYLVRHAEPEITGVLLGQCDPPLSDAGRVQAASILEGIEVAIVYASPLRRALETARILARGVPVEVIDDLREITYGAWDGQAWAQIEAADPDLARRKLRNWRDVTPPGGEPWEDFVARVKRAFDAIREGSRPAAIVAHAGVNEILGATGQDYGDVHEL
jgi:broad specificity phosphatase PhoE